ncbi:MAG TPA: phosphotransferase [Mycobacteriales bacterium]|nr:phosphotransferase [Mycobacteriales bacterium]
MRTQPADLSLTDLTNTLGRYWRRDIINIRYLPVGAGSQHWLAVDSANVRWFVTVDDLRRARIAPSESAAFGVLEAAWHSAVWLRDAGLEFVVAPEPAVDGSLVRRVGAHYAVTLFVYYDAEPVGDGDYPADELRGEVVELIGRLHAAGPFGTARPVTIPGRAGLDGEWAAGPYSTPARRLLAANRSAVETALERFDRVAARVAGGPAVLTHGEPHSANVLRRSDGRLLLIDWDTVESAVRERDLAGILPGGEEDRWWPRYRSVSGAAGVSNDAMRLYRAWWDLAEICEYVTRFRLPHDDDADHRDAWDDLQQYLPLSPELLLE